MASLRLTIVDDRKVMKKLNKLGTAGAKKVARKALREGAKTLRVGLRAHAPVLTGLTRKKLKVRALKPRRRGDFGVIVRTGTRKEMGIPAKHPTSGKATGYYPAVVEYKHRPWMRRTARQWEANVLATVDASVREQLEVEAKK